MRKIKIGVYAVLIFVLFFNARCLSMVPANGHEKIVLTTDRSLYITGEQINFYAILSDGDDFNASVKSKILYCEIITPEGNKIAGGKFLISQSSVSGCVVIPDNLLTGFYYIRAYTKLMRNYGSETFGYTQIRIINPGKNEVLATNNIQNIPDLKIMPSSDGFKDMLKVSLGKTVFRPRDTITISVQTTNSSISEIKNVSLSIVPESTQSSFIVLQPSKKPTNDKSDYYPENLGLSISGKLTEASSTTPLTGKKVNLSIMGQGRDFMAQHTDSIGRFFFALPDYYGSRDIFICAEKNELTNVKVWIDNDFSTTPLLLPTPEFTLTEQERVTVQNMAQNVEINSRFYTDSQLETQSTNEEELAFYGKPTSVIYLDNYIQLPTLEEYFNELPSQVKVRKRKGESYFAIQADKDLSFYDPLVLVDWVAINEPSKILAISPLNVSRIEVVNEDYLKGGQIYGGIVSIISKKGDFAGVDLPSTGIFINYQFLSENKCSDRTGNISSSIPDARNTVIWEPSLKIPGRDIRKAESTNSPLWKSAQTEQKSQIQTIVFTAPDTPGKYTAVFEGVTTKGEVFSVTSSFQVNN